MAMFLGGLHLVNADTTSIRWSSSYIDPLYYWHASGTVWSEFATARNDWNSHNTDFGDLTKWQNSQAPLSVCGYNDDDGIAGYFLAIPPTNNMNCAEIGLNNYYVTHDEYGNSHPELSSDVSLPLDAAWKRQSVSAHELGHCFGLAHPSNTVPDSIMITTGGGRLNRDLYEVEDIDADDVDDCY